MDMFTCNVITPERKLLECEAKIVVFPAHDGELGVLTHRAPLVCKMGIGAMRIEAADGNRRTLYVDGGFAEVAGNTLTILTEQAADPDELDADRAEQALAEARAMPITDDASFTARDKALQRARVQLRLARRSS
ncbi:MAG: ATP synthase F1 subunit epsilon [Planctomycetota bacterium]|nr:MAG: ATP synthase F1 subunit epsilon [Planctomycetota bacterium]